MKYNLNQTTMKNSIKFLALGLLAAVLFLASCEDDDDQPNVVETSYKLGELDASGVSGNVTFRKIDNASTLIIVQLDGTKAGDSHPAHIHANNAATGGPIVVDFTPVNGESGRSETTVTALKDGTPITYEGLLQYNGHVNVHKSAAEITIMIAQGNIGSNVSSGTDN
jgi:hypothetical protein